MNWRLGEYRQAWSGGTFCKDCTDAICNFWKLHTIYLIMFKENRNGHLCWTSMVQCYQSLRFKIMFLQTTIYIFSTFGTGKREKLVHIFELFDNVFTRFKDYAKLFVIFFRNFICFYGQAFFYTTFLDRKLKRDGTWKGLKLNGWHQLKLTQMEKVCESHICSRKHAGWW